MKYQFIADPYKEPIHSLGLNAPEAWLNFSEKRIVGDRTTKTHLLQPPAPLPRCYAKIYRYPRRDDRLRILLRGGLLGRSRARVEYDNLRILHRRGLAPQVVAFGQHNVLGLLRFSLLIVEEVKEAEVLDTFVSERLASLTQTQRKTLIRSLADFTKKMNTGRFVNSEYHWRNILVRQSGNDFSFQVIDPSSARLRHRICSPFFDLATLDLCAPWFFSRTERLRFFKQVEGIPAKKKLTPQQRKTVHKIQRLRERLGKKELNRYRKILPAF